MALRRGLRVGGRHPHLGDRDHRGLEDDLHRGSRVGNYADNAFGAWHHIHVVRDGEHKLVYAQRP